MVEFEIYKRLALALGIGLLIGFERGWQRRDERPGSRAAGIRTFSLIGLFGGLSGLLGRNVGDIWLGIAFGGLSVLLVVGYIFRQQEDEDRGMTTVVAALLTFGLGVLALRGDMVVAAASAVVIAGILDVKDVLHAFLQKIRQAEIAAGIKLLLVAVVLLPLLPNRGYGPGEVWNPYVLGWMVVLIAGITLGGHFALRFTRPSAGARMMGLIAGLASSTALTVTASRLAGRTESASALMAGSIGAGTATMFMRTLVIAVLLLPPLWPVLAPPLVGAALVAAVFGVMLTRVPKAEQRKTRDAILEGMKSPDDLKTAIQFALVLGAVMLIAYYAKTLLGQTGFYATAAISGLVDVDAVTVSATQLAGQPGLDTTTAVAATAILIAAAVNTMVKVAIAAWLGPSRLVALVAAMTIASVAAGGLILAAVRALL